MTNVTYSVPAMCVLQDSMIFLPKQKKWFYASNVDWDENTICFIFEEGEIGTEQWTCTEKYANQYKEIIVYVVNSKQAVGELNEVLINLKRYIEDDGNCFSVKTIEFMKKTVVDILLQLEYHKEKAKMWVEYCKEHNIDTN